jgi:hypothetical protein
VPRHIRTGPRAAIAFANPKSKIQDPKSVSAILLVVAVVLAASCTGTRQPVFAPAASEDAERALAAWRTSVENAELGPARLLYDARVSQGPFRMSGTLAVRESAGSIEATLSGPFGDTLASYRDGALTGKGLRPIAVDESDLRWLLAGSWRGAGPPQVGGVEGSTALLRWSEPYRVEAVIDSAAAQMRSLEVRRRDGALRAAYPDGAPGRPRRIDLQDLATGNTMRLTLVAVEPLRE